MLLCLFVCNCVFHARASRVLTWYKGAGALRVCCAPAHSPPAVCLLLCRTHGTLLQARREFTGTARCNKQHCALICTQALRCVGWGRVRRRASVLQLWQLLCVSCLKTSRASSPAWCAFCFQLLNLLALLGVVHTGLVWAVGFANPNAGST